MKKKITTFRFAEENDCGLILDFIRMLAEYEKMSDQVVATEDLLRESPAAGTCQDYGGTGLRQAGMGLPGLESAKHRFLSFTGG